MPLRLILLLLRRVYHYAVYVVGGALIVVCLAALTFKFWVMPRAGEFVPLLEARASAAMGQKVSIGRMEADWSGTQPRLILHDARMTPPLGEPLLLPRVEAVLSWLSLPLLEPRLASLTLVRPHLAARRDGDGVIHVAGMPMNVEGASSAFGDWLLRQHRVVVKDAEIRWRDAKLGAPELRVSRVRLLLENRFGRHRFGGIAHPADAAARLELRGDLKGVALSDWNAWSGRLYARVDDADFASWGRWVPWAQASVKRGTGVMRFWLNLERGAITGLSGDARLRGVAINVRGDLPDLAFDSLQGRVGWSRKHDVHNLAIDDLSFRMPGAAPTEPASVRVGMTPDGQGGFRRVTGKARNLRLEALTALAGALPLPRRGHDLIEALNPVGLVEGGEGHWAGAGDYAFKLRVRDAGARAFGGFPGFSGVSARIRADHDDGEIALEGHETTLEWPRLFRHDLTFARLAAKADWKLGEQGVTLKFDLNRIVNADLDGDAQGRVELPKSGAPRVDVRARLRHGKANAVYRYLPHAVDEDAYLWLRRALLGGHSDDTRLVLKGPLDRFPFAQGGGEFQVSVAMVDGLLDYAPGWPRIEGVRGRLLFQGESMTLHADSGRILDARLGPVRATIPDLHADGEILLVDGRAQGETRAFLDFIRRSPVHGYTEGFTERLSAVGGGELNLKLILPLRDLDASEIGGSYAFLDNRIDPGGDLPDLENVTGRIAFTDKSLSARGIRARVRGMPATLELDSRTGGQVDVRLTGSIGAAVLRGHLPASLAPRVRGATSWRAAIAMSGGGKPELSIVSDLVGLAIDLPQPFGKHETETLPLSVRWRGGDDDIDQVQARYGNRMALRARLPAEAMPWVHARFGTVEVEAPTQAGLTVSGALDFLDVDAWRQLELVAPRGDRLAGEGLALREASVNVREIRAMRRNLHDTLLRLRPAGKGWRLNLAGREIVGEVTALSEAAGTRVFANFKRLHLPAAEAAALPAATRIGPAQAGEPEWPATLAGLELSAESLRWKGYDLGELRLRLTPERQGLRVDNFVLKAAEGRIEGKGLLANHPRRPTRLDLLLETDNLGKLLARLGHPERIRDGSARASGGLAWIGGIEDFDLATLDGDVEFTVGKGQFLKVDPGAARLLGIVSLQALPRRIALDFRDVFSEGFAFDEIVGALHMQRGTAYTKDLRMNGPAAKVRMSGVIDLDKETQNLRLSIQPRLDDTMALAGALLGGPVVGIGALIAGKVLRDPIGQAVSFDYTLTGTWADPVVSKVSRPRQDNGAE